MRYKGIVIGVIAGLFMGMMLSSINGAEETGGIIEPKGREDIGLGRVAKEIKVVSVVGRLALEEHAKEQWLILHAKSADTYLIKGNLIEKLKDLLFELGEKNLVSVTGNQDGRSNVSCERSQKYDYDEKDETKLVISVKCIRYHYLEPTQILFAQKSDEEIPLPKRDIAEERRTMISNEFQGIQPLITGEIYGKIISVNFKSPIKTIKISNRDKNSPIKNIILMISDNTRIAKKIGEQEPMALTPGALRENQEITAVYSRDKFKNEALFITITKE